MSERDKEKKGFWSRIIGPTTFEQPKRVPEPPTVSPSGPEGEPKVVSPEGEPKVVSPEGEPKVVSPEGEPEVVSSEGEPKVVSPEGEPEVVSPVLVPEPEPEPASLPDPIPDPEPAPEPVSEQEEEAEAIAEAPFEGGQSEDGAPKKEGFFARLRAGLARSSSRLVGGIMGLFTQRKLDDAALEELEDLLITADLGVDTAMKLTQSLAKERFGKDVTGDEVRVHFAQDIAEILTPVARPMPIDPANRPHVVLVVGVNGSGKTTTIGKIANQLKKEGKTVLLAAGDTFRAAAVEQLKVWGERTGCPVISRDTGADAAGLAYDALQQARAEKYDVLLIDTAGRLHNKAELMDELKKVVRVIKKLEPEAPHVCLQVLDATVGQNAHQQVKVFQEMTNVSGLVMTKLDGTAKGGVVVALADKFGLPVHYVGVGEGIDDLRPFDAKDFANGLMGL
ncbi:signal recognition particle-docking protein FtsY [Rhodospirillum sp. A1_3_36]|uniref:signal recognition particle-docking protein FtsY n=1 Tax=Rhodospirillum sp. A1_3_36 TaxID=3391666 RepID=UPI0039A576EB